MAQSLALLIRGANAVLIADGNLDAIERFFSPEYVVNITGQRLAGGHDIVRKVLGSILKSFPDIQVEINVLLEETVLLG
ncbi:MAG: nuclear transport factor 2 family protein [Methylococcaceae bacterium]|nr:nuclear transport factor 2 family protein [Methylococcaceae bacterium]